MAAAVEASDIYPVVRRFLTDSGLEKTLKGFDKESGASAEEEQTKAKRKLAKKLAAVELTAACSAAAATAAPVEASDIYPVVRRFLTETGLVKTLKAFDKDIAAVAEEEQTKAKRKIAKKLADLELTAACQTWLEHQNGSNGTAAAAEVAPAAAVDKKKRKVSFHLPEAALPADAPPRKRSRTESMAKAAAKAEAAAEAEKAAAEAEATATKSKKSKKQDDKKPNIPFSRVDHAKWTAAIKDDRLKDNTHESKAKYGVLADSWGDSASADLLAVKGKGFRKEMAKKKRASWTGGGTISQVTNSIKFAQSSDEE
jgi:hypothetical protein